MSVLRVLNERFWASGERTFAIAGGRRRADRIGLVGDRESFFSLQFLCFCCCRYMPIVFFFFVLSTNERQNCRVQKKNRRGTVESLRRTRERAVAYALALSRSKKSSCCRRCKAGRQAGGGRTAAISCRRGRRISRRRRCGFSILIPAALLVLISLCPQLCTHGATYRPAVSRAYSLQLRCFLLCVAWAE